MARTEKCSRCKIRFDMAEEACGRYVEIRGQTYALCGGCAEDTALFWENGVAPV